MMRIMPTEILLPALADATQATIEHYFCQPGDALTPGQPLALVLTERFEWEIPATAAGTISAILAAPGTTVAVGAPLVQLDAAVESAAETTSTAVAATNGYHAERLARVTPLARKIAQLHGLDLATISGSGRGGLITRADVLTLAQDRSLTVVEPGVRLGFTLDPPARAQPSLPAAQPAPIAKAQPQLLPHSAPAAENPRWSLPHALAVVELDLGQVLAYVESHHQRLLRRGITLTPICCVAAAVVAALGQHRLLNSAWGEDGIILRGAIDLALEQPTERGTISRRVVQRAAELNVQGLARALSAEAESTAPASFTLAESGASHWSQAVVRPGQAALLSLGASAQRPTVITRSGVDTIVIRPLALLTLAYDARIVPLPQADAFLQTIKARVEHFSAL